MKTLLLISYGLVGLLFAWNFAQAQTSPRTSYDVTPAAKEAYARSLKEFLVRAGQATDDGNLLVQEIALESSR